MAIFSIINMELDGGGKDSPIILWALSFSFPHKDIIYEVIIT